MNMRKWLLHESAENLSASHFRNLFSRGEFPVGEALLRCVGKPVPAAEMEKAR